jgi:hypothetical protein
VRVFESRLDTDDLDLLGESGRGADILDLRFITTGSEDNCLASRGKIRLCSEFITSPKYCYLRIIKKLSIQVTNNTTENAYNISGHPT